MISIFTTLGIHFGPLGPKIGPEGPDITCFNLHIGLYRAILCLWGHK